MQSSQILAKINLNFRILKLHENKQNHSQSVCKNFNNNNNSKETKIFMFLRPNFQLVDLDQDKKKSFRFSSGFVPS